MVEYGVLAVSRDLGAIHDRFIAEGHAAWLFDAPPYGWPELGRDLARTVAGQRQIISAQAADQGIDEVQPR